MFIKLTSRSRAFSVLEVLVASAIFALVGACVCAAYLFSLRSFQGLSNYAKLDKQNRQAMDLITKEVREANSVVNFQNGNNAFLTLQDGNGANITYAFNTSAKTMTRSTSSGTSVLLKDCSLIKFNLGMRPGKTNTWGYWATTNYNDAKVVDLSWKTGLSVRAGLTNSENIQTAKIVIRKQHLVQN